MPGSADHEIADAEDLLKSGKFVDAARAYERALAGDPANVDLQLRRGQALLKAKRYDDALDAFDAFSRSAAASRALNDDYWLSRGEALEELGRAEEAIHAYDEVLHLTPGSRAAKLSKALLLWDLDDPLKVAEAFELLMEVAEADLGPEAATLYLDRKMRALEGLGSPGERLQFLDAILARRPGLGEAWLLRGNLLQEQGRLDEALESYRKGLDAEKDNDELWEVRADLQRELGDRTAAGAGYREALRVVEHRWESLMRLGKGPEDRTRAAMHYIRRAELLAKVGETREALASYDRAIEVSPEPQIPWRARGHLLREQGRFAEALEAYDRACSLAGDDAHTQFFRAYALKELDRIDGSLAAINEALKLRPGWPDGLKFKGHLLVHLGRFNEAADVYGESAGEDAEDPEAWYLRGLAFYYAADADGAVRSFREALEITPSDPEILEMNAHALGELGRTEEAAAHFDLAIRSGGPASRLHFSKGKVLLGAGDTLGALESFKSAGGESGEEGYDLYGYCLVATARGEMPEALRLVEGIVTLNPALAPLVRNDPSLASLRKKARFLELVGAPDAPEESARSKGRPGPPSPPSEDRS